MLKYARLGGVGRAGVRLEYMVGAGWGVFAFGMGGAVDGLVSVAGSAECGVAGGTPVRYDAA